MNKKPLATRGHKILVTKWLFEFRFLYQTALYLDSKVASKCPTFHTAKRSFWLKWADSSESTIKPKWLVDWGLIKKQFEHLLHSENEIAENVMIYAAR